jgi:ABC-type bacteriocin/lantibiotic exporter with double-glycine peptidase domain
MTIRGLAAGVALTLAAATVSAAQTTSLESTAAAPQGTVSQTESDNLCAANCLYLLCRYYNVPVVYEDIRALLPSTSVGVSMLTLKATAEQLGFETRAVEAKFRDLALFAGPLILRTTYSDDPRFGHFVVFSRDTGNRGYRIYDPPLKPKLRQFSNAPADTDDKVQILILMPSSPPRRDVSPASESTN